MKHFAAAFLFFVLTVLQINAQCPTGVNASASSAMICKGDTSQITTALIGGCSTYSVTNISYAPVAGAGTNVTLGDNQVSNALPIGFTFNFFCLDYTQFYISSNGFISFSSSGDGCCSGQFIPDASAPNNLVALAWEDFDPTAGGTINYFTTGTAPSRMLIVNYSFVPHAGGGGGTLSGQIILYETTNIIEIHTNSMTSDGGLHTQGIEDASGTIGFASPGRNAVSWSTSNNGKRFSPGPSPAGAFIYNWTPSTGLSSDTVPNPQAFPVQTTTYIITVSDTACPSVSDTIVINVDTTVISVSILTPDTAICSGSVPISVSATGAASYLWSPASGLSCTTCANPVSTPTSTVSYVVTASTSMGACSAMDTISIYVSNLKQFTAITNDSSICASDSAQLDVVSAGGPTSNYCMPTYGNLCSSGDYIENFSFNTIVNNVSGCNGNPNNYIYYSSLSTTVMPGNTYTMSMQAGASWAQGFGVWIDYNQNGSFNEAGEFVYGSPVAATTPFNTTVTIPMSAMPGTTRLRVACVYFDTLSASQSCDSLLVFGECEDYNVLISGSIPTISYSWSPSASVSNDTIANPMASPSVTTTYTVTISDSVCTVTDTVTIYVDTAAVAVSILTADTFICFGDSVPVAISSSGAASFLWAPAAGLSCTTCPNPIATPSFSTTYLVTAYTSQGSCFATDTIAIGVSSLTQITPTASPNPACGAGDSVQLNVAISGVPPAGYCTPIYSSLCSSGDYIENFSFNTIVNNATGCNGNTDNYIYYSSMNTSVMPGNTYTMSMQAGASWSQGFGVWIDYNQDGDFTDPSEFVYASPTFATTPFNTTVTIPMNALPGTTRLRVLCSYNSTIDSTQSCYSLFTFGECEDYDVNISGPQSNFSYSWVPSANLSNANIANPIATPSASTTYTVTVTDTVVGCSLSGIVTVTVNPLPTAVVTPSSITICAGQITTLTASGGGTYSWMPIGQTTSFVTVSTGNNYTVVVTDPAGCTASATSSVTVSQPPVITVSGSTSVCSGQSSTLTASGGVAYSWLPGGQTTSFITVTPSANTSYTVIGTNASGCSSSTAATVSVILPPVAAFTYTVNGSIVNFTSTSQNATSWNWNFGDGNTSASQNPFHPYANPGTYTVTLVVSNMCGSDSTTAVITIVSVEEYLSNSEIFIYPNPASNILNINIAHAVMDGGNLILLNILGEEIKRQEIPKSKQPQTELRIDISEIPSGIYLLKLNLPDGVFMQRVSVGN